MSDQLKKLIDDQNRTWTRMQEIMRSAETDGWTAELRGTYDEAEKHLDEVSGDIERLNRAAQLEKVDFRKVVDVDPRIPEAERPKKDTDEDRSAKYADAFGAYLRHGMSGLSLEQQRMLQDSYEGPEKRALAVGTDSAGGYLVPDEFRNQMMEAVKSFGGLMNLATVITTTTGAPLAWPTNDDTANVGAILGENTQIGEQDLTFDQDQIGAYTYTSKLVRVPWQLLQDSAFALEPFLARKLGERIGRAAAGHFVTGTGSAQPQGLVAGATAGVTAAGTTAVTYDELVDLEHSIDPAYRANARYVLSDGALKVLRKLKDADNRPLFQPVPSPGFPATINGVPYTIDNSMAAIAAGSRSILYGDIAEAYLVRQVQGVQLVTMRERYADYLQTGYFAFSRMDAMIQNAAAARVLIQAAS